MPPSALGEESAKTKIVDFFSYVFGQLKVNSHSAILTQKHGKIEAMKVNPFYTHNSSDPYTGLNFISHSFDYDGEKIDFIAPKEWGALAVEILWSKFARKKGVPPLGYENDARQIFHRLAHTWRLWGERLGYFSTPEDATHFEHETLYMLSHQIAAPNSPQWFNTGIFDVYGIKGNSPEGHFAYDFETQSFIQTSGAYERPQAHACFIQSVNDELLSAGGIFDLLIREARLFKYGSGTGSNFSNIRGRGEKLAGGGQSSGLMSFLDVFDRSAGVIQSGGTTRRAAKMICLDADHPDVEDFVNYKKREEDKVATLILGSRAQEEIFNKLSKATPSERGQLIEELAQSGVSRNILLRYEEMIFKNMTPDFPHFDADWEGAAYKSVSGQNANFSLRLNETFFSLLESDGQWPLSSRTSKSIVRTIAAKDLWQQIETAAWVSADPGIQFHDTINDWNTCKSDGEIRASNPCSEYMFLDETACNLASLNLLKFFETPGILSTFNMDAFVHACELWTLILDISVSMASYPSLQMAKNGLRYRTLGLGFANLGASVMAMGLAYDSDEARSFAGLISAAMTGSSYRYSCKLAAELGSFEAFKDNEESMLEVLGLHQAALIQDQKVLSKLCHKPLSFKHEHCEKSHLERAKLIWTEVRELASLHGVRNAQVSVVAPTGTIGLMMDCDTTGIEPEYSLIKYKKIAGSKTVKIVNRICSLALGVMDFKEEEIAEIEKAIFEESAPLSKWLSPSQLAVFDCALASVASEGRLISSSGHLKMMAVVQPFISGAISKTVNIPFDSSPHDIGRIYQEARKLMLKAVAIYRDGSKLGQPLMQAREVVCRNCGKKGLISTGSCFVCSHCGTSTGCS